MRKRIEAKINRRDENDESFYRRTIQDFLDILRMSEDDAGWDEIISRDTIAITVGSKTATIHVCPMSWDAAERFIRFCIGGLLKSDDLIDVTKDGDRGLLNYEYYQKLLAEQVDALKIDERELMY